MQPDTRVGARLDLLEPAQDVDLLGGVALAQQLVHRLDGASLDAGEAVQLEGPAQGVEHLLLDDALLGQQLGEPAQRGGLPGHHSPREGGVVGVLLRWSSSRNGFVARS